MDQMPREACYAWEFDNLRFIEPFEVKGKLRLYDVDDGLLKYKPDDETYVHFAERCYKPLMRWEDREISRKEIEAMWEEWIEFLNQVDSGNQE